LPGIGALHLVAATGQLSAIAPVDGVTENAGEGAGGGIATRDKNGVFHEILHIRDLESSKSFLIQ